MRQQFRPKKQWEREVCRNHHCKFRSLKKRQQKEEEVKWIQMILLFLSWRKITLQKVKKHIPRH